MPADPARATAHELKIPLEPLSPAPALNIRQTTHIEAFAERALPFLQRRPAEHNLLLALLRSLQKSPPRQPPALITVEQDQRIVAVALQTAARPLLLSRMDSPAPVEAIAHHLKTCWPTPAVPLRQSLPQFGGPKAEAALLAKTLRRWTGLRYGVSLNLRIHKLQRVRAIISAEGKLRPANLGDRPLLIDWIRAFEIEAFGEPRTNPETWTDRAIAAQSTYLWDTAAGAVALAAGQGSSHLHEGGRIGPVYTPPQNRCRGYATAATAALSQHLLDQGCPACYLFTDLSNPTSNRIYKAIGYLPVCDWREYAFLP